MNEEILTPEVETEAQESAITPEPEAMPKGLSRTRKVVTSLLGALGIFTLTNAYDVVATTHNYRVEDARAQKDLEARKFDITRAKVVQLVNLDEQDLPGENVR